MDYYQERNYFYDEDEYYGKQNYPISIKKKYRKIANPYFEFALSTTCSVEKAKTFLKKGKKLLHN